MGKAAVARQFADLGAAILDADQAGHEALRLPQVEAAAKRRWGNVVFGLDGRIDRARLARTVFAPGPEGRQERSFLEQLTHPEIARRLKHQAEELAVRGTAFAVLDAALLLEAGWDQMCERVVFVEAPRAIRLARAMKRGWSEEDFTAREGAQDSLDHKRSRADVIIDNSDSHQRTQAQVEQVWASLLS